MIFRFEDKLYKTYWCHRTPNACNPRYGNVIGPPGTFAFIQELNNRSAETFSGFARLHPKDQYKKTTGRFISFHCAYFEFLCSFPEDKRLIWQDQLHHVFSLVLEQYQVQMPNDFLESNVALIKNITSDYTKNPWYVL